LASLNGAPPSQSDEYFRQLVKEFEDSSDLYVAAEIISAAAASLIEEDPAIDRAAKIILADNRAPASLVAAVQERGRDRRAAWKGEGLRTDPEGEARKDVGRLRAILVREPRNSIRRVDLSLAHAILGEEQKALDQMTAALGLAPDSRFVLRSATRLFVHVKEHDRALRALHKSQRLAHDPWLLAAEMSTSQAAGKKIQTIRVAREMLTSQDFSPHALSELGSELATQEIYSGRDKVARRLFEAAMREPNENAVAQAQWAAKKGRLDFDTSVLEVERAFEARSRVSASQGEWDDAVQNGLDWLRDQPFARDAALFTSYWAGTGLADYRITAEVSEQGLRVHPNDAMLNNNAAFAYANLDELAAARRAFGKLPKASSSEYTPTFRATEGLILYREGALDLAREAYAGAIRKFRSSRESDSEAVATLQRAIEEIRIDPRSIYAADAAADFRNSIKELRSAIVPALLRQLENAVTRAATRAFL
jgi:hypothetical protein